MQVPTNIEGMFQYSILPIIILTGIVIFLCFKLFYKKKEKLEVFILTPDDLNTIKKKYLTKMQELEQDYTSKKITSRKAYQRLSIIIRKFIFEVTGVKVQNYTLQEIESINIPKLTELVREYYDPEFARHSNGDTESSISKTKEVITKWK